MEDIWLTKFIGTTSPALGTHEMEEQAISNRKLWEVKRPTAVQESDDIHDTKDQHDTFDTS